MKPPPTRILPSAWTAIELTVSFGFGLNESANPVTASSRAMLSAHLSADGIETATR